MIVCYIHICQKLNWRRSLNMIFEQIKNSGLMNEISEIRCGIVNDHAVFIDDDIFHNPKVKIIYVGYSYEYERPTLLHMRNSITENSCVKYLYCHTKGIRWFGTEREQYVIDWIKLLIYWNIEQWKIALEMLKTNDTYGCNYYVKDIHNPSHYSGNFFWVNSEYLKKLPNKIGNQYNDPEFWLCQNNPKYCNIFSSGLEGMGHYNHPFPEIKYKTNL